MDRSEARAGMAAIAPMLIGVVPFGLVAGATPVAKGLGPEAAVGLSTIVFAGASQLAVADVLGGGGSAIVAALAAWTINLRMVLYSASLAPHLAHTPLRHRLGASYLLVDQNFAAAITRWTGADARNPTISFLVAAGALLWAVWLLCTIIGALLGSAVPEELPLDFAVPLVFLVLLVPAVTDRPGLVAAAVGGGAAVGGAELGAGPLSVMIGAVAGITAGVAAEVAADRRRGPRSSDPAPGPDPAAEGPP